MLGSLQGSIGRLLSGGCNWGKSGFWGQGGNGYGRIVGHGAGLALGASGLAENRAVDLAFLALKMGLSLEVQLGAQRITGDCSQPRM